MKVNPALLFSDEISILEGAILPFATMFERNTWYSARIRELCREEGIALNIPFMDLKEEKKSRLTEIISLELVRRQKESKSDYVRSEIEKFMSEVVCDECGGTRLKSESLGVTIDKKSISDVADFAISDCLFWVRGLNKTLSTKELEIGEAIIKEIETRLIFLVSVGVEYLTLGRGAGTLAGGEAQRIRLASQIGSGLTGVLYVLDEPTIGLHPKDSDKLINTLKRLRDLSNTVVVVEHDKETIESSDYIFDFGPGAGKNGGNVIAEGTYKEIIKNEKSITGQYLSGKRKIEVRIQKSDTGNEYKKLKLTGAGQYNLKNLNVEFPLGKFIVVTGVSGSGKSTLVVETLYHALAQRLNPMHRETPGAFKSIEGFENLDKVILVDQSPIGRTPRSNPATYTKIFDLIRQVYSQTKDSRLRGYKEGRFSFNVKGGRCEACEGQGQIKIEMQFMPDLWVACEVCHGKRYNSQTLEVFYNGKTIADVLALTITEAKEFFHAHVGIVSKLETLEKVGLNYMELGQAATTLSGGEAQRVKLASELGKRATGRTFYILDEPTTGLHFADLEKLLVVLHTLVSRGNTVLVIEHNLDVIKNADWIIDMGPGGGVNGGNIVAQGILKDIKMNNSSYTGKYLK
mgnify:FL=1